MKAKTILYIFIIAAACFTSGCSSEFDEPEILNDAEVAYADIALSFGSDWTIDFGSESRGAPPGTGGNNDTDMKVDGEADMSDVDCVRVIAFKRRDNGTNGDFIYDITNDMVLPVESTPIMGTDGKPTGHKHRVAKGKLKKVYGYQYRVIAIAYASQKICLYNEAVLYDESNSNFKKISGEHKWFGLNTDSEPTFDSFAAKIKVMYTFPNESGIWGNSPNNNTNKEWRDFMCGLEQYSYGQNDYAQNVGILSRNVIQVPQMFYANLKSETGKDIIEFAETDAEGNLTKGVPLKGILYRGVAKLKINLKPYFHKKNGTTDSDRYVCWVALLADNVQTDVKLNSYDSFLNPTSNGLQKDKYTVVAYRSFSEEECNSPNDNIKAMTSFFLQTGTRLVLRIKTSDNKVHNYQIKTTSNVLSGGNGTGIISPDVVDGVFYLRRNHSYSMKIDLQKLVNSSHKLDK